MNKIRINQGRVLDSGYRYLISLLLVCLSMGSVIGMNDVVGFILALVWSFLLIMVWTSFYIVEIDMDRSTYNDLTSILGRTFGSTNSFDGIEKVFINSSTTSQTRQGYGPNSYVKKHVEYKAFVKFRNGEKLFLVSDEDEKELIKRLQPVLKKLGTNLS